MALETLNVIQKFGTYTPVISKVFEFMREVINIAQHALKNEKKCDDLRHRLKSVHEILETQVQYISSDYPFGQRNTEYLMRILERIHKFIRRFEKRGFKRFFTADSIAKEIRDLHRDLDSALTGITTYMTANGNKKTDKEFHPLSQPAPLPLPAPITNQSSKCGQNLAVGEIYYHCRTCTTCAESVLCRRCYEGTNHNGHDVIAVTNTTPNAWCDCGDSEYWRIQLICKFHSSTGIPKCGKKVVVGEMFYECRTCSSRDNSILCRRCFEGTRHDGHYVLTAVSNNASNWCDCGDSDYWKVQLNCKHHSYNISHTSVVDSFQCGAKIAIGETMYYCRTCSIRDNSVICGRCYVGTNHIGHDIFTIVNYDASAWCDCGDPDYWRIPLNCKYHSATGSQKVNAKNWLKYR